LALAAIIAIAKYDLNAADFISRGVEGVGEKSKESDAWMECSMESSLRAKRSNP
jgi:hypothetical protein